MKLAEFVETDRRTQNLCKTCALPPEILAEVDEGLAKGLKPPLIARWLKAEGHDSTPTRIRGHIAHGPR